MLINLIKGPIYKSLVVLGFSLSISGCSILNKPTPMPTVPYVDLDRFMGTWYVIANIPTFIEKGAHNAIEHYALNEDGTIATTFTFNKDAFDGPLKKFEPKGFIRNEETNALWGMQFIWPFKADYRIVYLNEAYSQTIIGRKKRDYVWIMARTPSIPETDLKRLITHIDELGYDTEDLRMVPQQPLSVRQTDTP